MVDEQFIGTYTDEYSNLGGNLMCDPLREPHTIDGGDPGGGLSSLSSSSAATWGNNIFIKMTRTLNYY